MKNICSTHDKHMGTDTVTITDTVVNTENITETETKRSAEELKKTSYAEFVTMTNDEYSSLIEKFSRSKVDRMIEVLNNYKGANGKKYMSDYRAILSWVADSVKNDPSFVEQICITI